MRVLGFRGLDKESIRVLFSIPASVRDVVWGHYE